MKQPVLLVFLFFSTFSGLVFGQAINEEQENMEKAALYFKNDSLQQLVEKLATENALLKVQQEEMKELLEMQSTILKERKSVDLNEQSADSSLLKIKYKLPVASRKIIVPLRLEGLEITEDGKLAYQLVVDQDGRVVYVKYDENSSTIGREDLSFEIEERIKSTVRYEVKKGPFEKIAFAVSLRKK
jgi:hypothetical protein